jgi:5'(3')-deoxyribonucleotidase
MPKNKKILYIDMDNVLVDFKSAFSQLDKKILDKYKGDEDEIPGIFSLMKPMNGAVDAFQTLSEIYGVYVLSTASWNNPSSWSDKLEWVKKYLGEHAYKRLILSHHKDLNKGDFLIDDRTKNGADKFNGELILFGSEKYKNWNIVTEYLKSKAND